MGVGYEASALHLINSLVVDESAPYTTEPPAGSGLPLDSRHEIHDWRPPVSLSCRERNHPLARSIGGEIPCAIGRTAGLGRGEREPADKEAATSADVMLRYVAAIVEERGPGGLRGLVGAEKPPHEEIRRALDGVDRRGFTGRFYRNCR